MICKNCGADIMDTLPACPVCGTAVIKPKKRKKWPLITGISIGSIAVLALIIIIGWNMFSSFQNRNIDAFKKAIEARNYYDASEIFQDLTPKELTTVNDWLVEYVIELENNYYDGALNYSTTYELLEEIKQFGAAREGAYIAQDNIYLDHQSTIYFEEATEFAENGDWFNACWSLQNISSSYRRYDEVVKFEEECLSNYRQAVLELLATYATSEDIYSLLSTERQAMQLLPDDKEIIATVQTYLDEFVENKLADADALAQTDDLNGAIDLLVCANEIYYSEKFDTAIDEYMYLEAISFCETQAAENNYSAVIQLLQSATPDDPRYQELLNYYTDIVVDTAIQNAETAYQTSGYTDAISILNTALSILPDNAELTTEKTKYSSLIPVPITELDVIRQGEFFYVGTISGSIAWNSKIRNYMNELYTDVNGTVYSQNDFHYHCKSTYADVDTNDKSITYHVNQKYNTLTGTIYHPYVSLRSPIDFSEWSNYEVIEIYGDGILLYSGSMAQDFYEAVDFSVDISGVRELTITLSGTWYDADFDSFYRYPLICLANLEVSKTL